METPSSTRRVTRSQALAANGCNFPLPSSRKLDESEKSKTKSGKPQQQDRSALIDITNDSPIIGLAAGSLLTPSSVTSKKKSALQSGQSTTPGSGEALLRGQVKTLLQKIEEEKEPFKVAPENRPIFKLHGLGVNSPMPISLVAPTPANTPQVNDLSAGCDCLPSVTPVSEKILIPQMKIDEKQEGMEVENLVTRSLLLDFSEKSASNKKSRVYTDDDDSSIWSIQANASSTLGEDEYEDDEEDSSWLEEEDYYDDQEEEYEDDGGLVNELCQGMNKMRVGDWPKFAGKHIRFVYNSDDEIAGEEEVVENEHQSASASASASASSPN